MSYVSRGFGGASTTDWGQRIESDDAGDATLPSLAVDARGQAVAVWQQTNGTRVDVLSNRFE
ncbi:MAG TPA: hypothetical protein VJR89_07440 [Polyangiales bacterium]|nr:hypothetical protein [Polyangiales bacterium]